MNKHELDRLHRALPDRLACYEGRSLPATADQIDRPVFLAHSVRDVDALSETVISLRSAVRERGMRHELQLLQRDGASALRGGEPSRPAAGRGEVLSLSSTTLVRASSL
jgi:hypothetical protein